MLIRAIILYDFVGEVGLECSTQCVFLMKLESNALPNVLMSVVHIIWITRIDTIFGIVDDIV